MIRRERLGRGFIRLNLRAMGVSNLCYDKKERKYKSIQFYDYDGELTPDVLESILSLFPNDALSFKTKDGYHFISFTLLPNLRIAKARALKLSKDLDQDYWCSKPYLILRFTPKWKVGLLTRRYKVKSPKPFFHRVYKTPSSTRSEISSKHLDLYYNMLGLPNEVYNMYSQCLLKSHSINIHHYKARL